MRLVRCLLKTGAILKECLKMFEYIIGHSSYTCTAKLQIYDDTNDIYFEKYIKHKYHIAYKYQNSLR